MTGVVVLGSANMDLVVRQPRRAEPGETLFGTDFSTGPGGKGLNQAIAAARAGASVRFIGAVGTDAFAERLRDRLVADGVDVEGLRTVPGATGIAQITVTDDGQNTIVVVPAANADRAFNADDRSTVAAASHLVVQLERPIELLEVALRHARDAGVTTVLTPAPARAGLDALLDLADVLVPNEGEAMMLSGRVNRKPAMMRKGTVADSCRPSTVFRSADNATYSSVTMATRISPRNTTVDVNTLRLFAASYSR